MRSCLYTGEIMHRRRGSHARRFRYRSVAMLIDLDELEALDRRLRLFSVERANLYSFRSRDHAEGHTRDLKAWALACLRAAGLSAARVELLCFPRLFGTVFNPLAVFFCYGPDGRLTACIHQVSNTFSERHSYVIAAEERGGPGGWVRQACAKAFYVSPFLPERGRYRFRFRRPDERLVFTLDFAAGPVGLFAAHSARREPLTDRNLLRRFMSHPAMTWKVIAGIHWQALKLWRAGAPIHRHRPAPAHRVTIVEARTGEALAR